MTTLRETESSLTAQHVCRNQNPSIFLCRERFELIPTQIQFMSTAAVEGLDREEPAGIPTTFTISTTRTFVNSAAASR